MRRAIPIIILLLLAIPAGAQLFKKSNKSVAPEYQAGAVPVVNGRVTFEEFIPADGLTAAQVDERVGEWISKRFVQPTVIASVLYDSGKEGTTILKGEEYIVFKKNIFVLSRARTYYFLTLEAQDGGCLFNMSRITYWYDDEDEDGGLKMKAENWITDEMAFNKKGKLKRFEGKFRRKTIDLKNQLVKELGNELNSK
jgi:hypothetical protein